MSVPFFCSTDKGNRSFNGNFCTELPGQGDSSVNASNGTFFSGHAFCTIPGPGGDRYRDELCDRAEWGYKEAASLSDLCLFSTCYPNQQLSDQCLYCFPVPGTSTNCVREKYQGRHESCCFADMLYDWDISLPPQKALPDNSAASGTFYQSEKCIMQADETCDPAYRNLVAAQCQSIATPYCAGDDVQDDSWMIRWLQGAPEPTCPSGQSSQCQIGGAQSGVCNPTTQVCHYQADGGGNCTLDTQCLGGKGTCQTDGTCTYSLGILNNEWMGGKDTHAAISLPPGPIPDSNISNLPPCQYYLYRMLFYNPYEVGASTVPIPLNQSTLPSFQQHIRESTYPTGKLLFQEMLSKYSLKYTLGTTPGNPGYNAFQDQIFQMCSQVPGLCDDALSDLCSSVTPRDLALNPQLQRWCGCFMSDEFYQEYTQRFQISKMCTPWCAGPPPDSGGPLKPADSTGLTFDQCCQSSCIIDQASIDLANTTVNGQVSINQVCGACAAVLADGSAKGVEMCKQQGFNVTSQCTCIIKDVSIDVAGSIIGGDVSLKQFCSGGTTCYRTNPLNESQSIVVDCSTQSSAEFDQLVQQAEAERAAAERAFLTKAIIFILIVVGVVVAFYLVFWFLSRR